MILGVMQPYFFPYLGYLDLINYSDRWVIFDTVQYVRHGWINRNRILHPKEGWQYIIVPTRKSPKAEKISNIQINNDSDWAGKIIGQLQHYKKTARFFRTTIDLVGDCLSTRETSLSRLNAKILAKICSYLDIPFKYEFFSEMNLNLGPVEGPGDWALRISQALGAQEYVNPPGGRRIFDPSKFAHQNIKLTIRDIPPMEYSCRRHEFVPRLSIIDALMWNSSEQIKYYLDQQKSSRSANAEIGNL